MKKEIIQRGLLGFPLGIAIGYVITLLVSVLVGKGVYYPVSQSMIEGLGNELNAVLVQTLLCGVVGSGFAMASVIWEINSWGLAKQSAVYFTIACLVMFPISYIADWMPHSVGGVIVYVVIFVIIYVVVVLVQHIIWKNKVQELNAKLPDEKQD